MFVKTESSSIFHRNLNKSEPNLDLLSINGTYTTHLKRS